MPRSWSAKRERQYQRIKKEQKERGRSEDRAAEIASRTVNIEGRSKMTKAELARAVGR